MEAKFFLSRRALLKQYSSIRSLCDVVSYSTKTNYEVAKILEKETDCSFSVHSIEDMGVIGDLKRVWFFPQGWERDEIKKILAKGVRNFVVDNETDLNLLLEFMKGKKPRINLLLRMRLKEHTIHTGKYFVYGMYSDTINRLVPELRRNKGIERLGVHFHRMTQNLSEWELQHELSQLLKEETLKSIDYLNIGGGIPVVYKNFRMDMTPRIFLEIGKLRKWLSGYGIKLMTEPGRYIAAPAIRLVARIKMIYEGNIIINCSVYNSAMDTFVASTKLEVEGELPEGQGKAYTIKGYTPDSMDIFRYRVYLNEPKAGDKIVFLNAGAYNFSTDFCGLKRLKTETVD